MHANPDNEIPRFDFIRRLGPDLSEDDLRQADLAFFAYVELVKSVCDDLAQEDRVADISDSETTKDYDRVVNNV